jgi:hypothetical protein
MIGVTPRDWVAAFYVVVGIVVVATLGLRPLTALVNLSVVLMTVIANRACSSADREYWRGLKLIASINPSGETFVGQLFVLPALAVATVYSWFLGITWVFGAREWPRKRWFAFLRGYREFAVRMSPKH